MDISDKPLPPFADAGFFRSLSALAKRQAYESLLTEGIIAPSNKQVTQRKIEMHAETEAFYLLNEALLASTPVANAVIDGIKEKFLKQPGRPRDRALRVLLDAVT